MNTTFRLYAFTHVYMSSIQHGIQTGHAMGEIFNEYVFADREFRDLQQYKVVEAWCQNNKTWIALDGGNSRALREVYEFLEANPVTFENVALPWADFREDEDSMEGMRTAVAIVLPEEIYNAVPYKRATSTMDTDAYHFFIAEYPREEYENHWFWFDPLSKLVRVYSGDSVIGQFLTIMKRCKLAS